MRETAHLAIAYFLACAPIDDPDSHLTSFVWATEDDAGWIAGESTEESESTDGPWLGSSTEESTSEGSLEETSESTSEGSDSDSLTEDSTFEGVPDMGQDHPRACGDRVPEDCLAIKHDTSHCMTGSTCERSACIQRAFSDFRIDMMRCIERECGVEPRYDLGCVERWHDLEEACITEYCDLGANTCQHMALWGWQAECMR